MGEHDDLGAAVAKLVEGRQRGPDPAVVGDRLTVQRHVQVAADQDPLAAQVAKIRN